MMPITRAASPSPLLPPPPPPLQLKLPPPPPPPPPPDEAPCPSPATCPRGRSGRGPGPVRAVDANAPRGARRGRCHRRRWLHRAVRPAPGSRRRARHGRPAARWPGGAARPWRCGYSLERQPVVDGARQASASSATPRANDPYPAGPYRTGLTSRHIGEIIPALRTLWMPWPRASGIGAGPASRGEQRPRPGGGKAGVATTIRSTMPLASRRHVSVRP